MHKIVYLSLGSNLGDRAANLRTALDRLADMGAVAAVSSFYETEPMEFREPLLVPKPEVVPLVDC